MASVEHPRTGTDNVTQVHLEHLPNKFSYVEDQVYYNGPILDAIHASSEARGYPDVYVNGKDAMIPTVTVDPLKNAQWMLPHNAERHSFSVHRGALKDHASVMETQRLVDKGATGSYSSEAEGLKLEALRHFMPTSKMIDNADKFTPRCTHNSTRGVARHGPGWGKLPIVSQLLYKNLLRDKPDWLVETEVVLANTHASRDRSYDGKKCGPCPTWMLNECTTPAGLERCR